MKPPPRKRSAPARFEVDAPTPARTLRLAWTPREKMELLKGLKAQRTKKVPTPPVRGRSQSEVSSYIAWLRGRAAREAVQTEYKKWGQLKRDRKTPAHIEVWTDLVCRMSSQSEDALSAAFSQMLTIASTEPVTRGSKSNAPAAKVLQQKRSMEEKPASLREVPPAEEEEPASSGEAPPAVEEEPCSSGEAPPAVEEEPCSSGEAPPAVEEEPCSSGEVPSAVEEEPTDDRWKKLDFEKIYKYLSKVAKEEPLPKLSECESAVVLHLLACLSDQLQTLNARPLSACLRKSYTYMSSQHPSEDTPKEEAPDPQDPNWKELKFCPLNPFLLPLELLQPKKSPEALWTLGHSSAPSHP